MCRAVILLLVLAVPCPGEPINPRSAKPPVAKKVPHLTELHGEKLLDHYFWLRDKKSPEVIAYLEAENAYTAAVMKPTLPLQEKLYQEMLARIKQTDLSAPYRLGPYWYYVRTEEGKQYAIHCRKRESLEGKEEILLELNELARGHPFLGLDAFTISDDGNLLAYSLDITGFRDYTLHVKDLRTGVVLPDRVAKVRNVVWAADNRTLFYVVEDHAKRPYRVFRHRLGSKKDELVYEEKDELYRLSLKRSRDKAILFLSSDSMTTSEARFLPADRPDQEPKILFPREEGHEYTVDHRLGQFWVRTNKGAQNFRLVRAPAAAPLKWEEVAAHDPRVSLESFFLFKDFCVLADRAEGLTGFRVLNLRDGKSHRLTFPEPIYTVAPEANPEFDTALFRHSYQSFTTPLSIFEYDLGKRESTLLKATQVQGDYDPKKYVSERRHAVAPDGTQIPISLVYRKDRGDLPRPMLLYGYGAYGSSLTIGFNSNRLGLLDRGVVFALAHVRGGGDLGPAWHVQGRMLAKRNSFTDFIACADHLIKEKITTRDRLVIQGRSAGGLLMGGVLTLKPDVARAAILEVPFVEAVNSMLDLDMPLVIQEFLEWGNPRKKEEYAYMKSYCPYTNLKAQDYPSLLVTAYYHDSQVMYWEAAKYTAKLRALKTDAQPLLLRTSMAGGHGGASGRYDGLREQAFIHAFILNQMGIDE